MTTGWIAQASTRWDGLTESSGNDCPLLCATLVSESLGQSVATCQLCTTNGRSRIYRVEMDDGTTAIAKQLCVGEADELELEYNYLAALARMQLQFASVPEPIQYLPSLRAYLMQRVTGTSIAKLIRCGQVSELCTACRLTGSALGELHQHWCAEYRKVATQELWDDLEQLALPLSPQEVRIIVRSLQRLRGEIVAVGQPYLDFKPANIILDTARIVLIDPPEQCCGEDLLAWDVAVFRQCLEQESWIASLTHPFSSCRRKARRATAIFERAYLQAHPEPVPTRDVFNLLVAVLELQRIGQLLALQHGKLRRVRSAHYRNNHEWSRRLIDAASVSASLPWFRARARRLIQRMAYLL